MLTKTSVFNSDCGIRRENQSRGSLRQSSALKREKTAEHIRRHTFQSTIELRMPAVDQWSVLITLPNQISLDEPRFNRGRTPRMAI
jgi:hypothetical protein